MDSLCSIKKVCPVCKKEFNDLSRDLCGCNNSLKFKIFFKENNIYTFIPKEFNSKSEILDYLYDSVNNFYRNNQITKECEEKAFDYLNWIKENENKDLNDIQDFMDEVKDFLNRLIITEILIKIISLNGDIINDFIFKVNNNIFFQESSHEYSEKLKEPLDDTGYIFQRDEIINKIELGLKIDVSELYSYVKDIMPLANYYGTLNQKEIISNLNEFVQVYDSYRSKLNSFLLKEVSIEKWDDFKKSPYFDSIKLEFLKKEFTQPYFKILLNNARGTEEISEDNRKFIEEYEELYCNIENINEKYLFGVIDSLVSKNEFNNYLNSFSKAISQDEKEEIENKFKWLFIKSNLLNIGLENNDLTASLKEFYYTYYASCSEYSFNLFVEEKNKFHEDKQNLLNQILDELSLNEDDLFKIIADVSDLIKKCDKPSLYMDYDNQIKFRDKHRDLILRISYIRNILDDNGFIYNNKDPFYFYKLLDFDTFFKEWNNNYVQKELENNKNYFDEMGLNEEQREAVIRNPNVLRVIAGAGSGKTSTIVAKVKYLIDIKKVAPEKIACISYTNDAVDNLKRRIDNDGVFISTIHIFAKEIAGFNEYFHKPGDIFNKYIKDVLKKDNKIIGKLWEYFSYYLREPPVDVKLEKGRIDNLDETLRILQSLYYGNNKYVTFKDNEEVKSLGELIIANYLYIHQIGYKYEDLFPISKFYENKQDRVQNRVKIDKRKSYRPDFYLPKYGIYIEHFGLDENHRAPWLNEFKESEYLKERSWKLNLFKECGVSYIETFDYYVRDDTLVKNLEEKLKENGVEIKQNYEEIFKKLLNNGKLHYQLELFKELVVDFLSKFKSRGFVEEDLSKFIKEAATKIENDFQKKRSILFLKIMEDFYNYYETEKDSQCIEEGNNSYVKGFDFQDGIIEATKRLNDFDSSDYDYIIIDEFQDAYPIIFDLLSAFRNKKCNIMMVEDDWQSIFRYAGSEVNLSNQFSKEGYGLETVFLENNYRNPQSLIDVSSNFIKKNAVHSNKKLKSKRDNIENPLKVVYINSFSSKFKFEKRYAFKYYVEEISKFSNEIMVLGRYTDSYKFIKNMDEFKVECIKKSNGKCAHNKQKIIYLKNLDLNIIFSTVHAAKGLEAENVIILDLNDDVKAFPNKMGEDSVLSFIMSGRGGGIYTEERRLFYVALTRSKNRCYLISEKENPSIFISELLEDGYLKDETPNLKEFINNSKKDKK